MSRDTVERGTNRLGLLTKKWLLVFSFSFCFQFIQRIDHKTPNSANKIGKSMAFIFNDIRQEKLKVNKSQREFLFLLHLQKKSTKLKL